MLRSALEAAFGGNFLGSLAEKGFRKDHAWMFLSRHGRLVLLIDPVQVLAWEGKEIWSAVKSDPDLAWLGC